MMGKATDVKQSARSRRLLSLIASKDASVEQVADCELLLIKITGERTIKCPRAIMALWLSSGLVRLATKKGEQFISVTDEGENYVKRGGQSALNAHHLAPETTTINVEGKQMPVSVARNESPLARLAKKIGLMAKSMMLANASD